MLVLRCCGCGVLYVSFGSKVRPQNLWVALPWVVPLLCIVLSRQKLCVGMVVCISWLHSYLCVWM